jgi:hypothetical protein
MEKPYIKKHSEISNFTVWVVDGKYIRDNIDIQFTSYGQHYLFKFIPENEFWLDKERTPNEDKYYINSMLRMNKSLAEGMEHKKAVEKDNKIETEERMKEYDKEVDNEEKIKIVHKKLLKKYSNKIKVWVVDGKKVRDLLYVEFTEGGHDKVYPFIPKGEIWLDDDNEVSENKVILLHEVFERNLMAGGGKYDKWDLRANDAHKEASTIELYYRKNPDGLDEKLAEELAKTNQID